MQHATGNRHMQQVSDFVHLHVHSSYSMMRGASSPSVLCREAKKAGYTRLAITDTNGLYGLMNFLDVARETGIKPIVGASVEGKEASAVILAKTVLGYEILCDLITSQHTEKDFSIAASLPEKSGEIVLISENPELVKDLKDRFECYLEIVPGPKDRQMIEAAKTIGVQPVASNSVHFAREEDYPFYSLVRAIGLNKTLGTLSDEDAVPPGRWLKSAREMAAHFPNCQEALANASRIAESCQTSWDNFRTVFPYYRDKEEDHFRLLLCKCRDGISWRYGKTCNAIEQRLKEELDLIASKGFVDYFLVVADIVHRRPIHCGRGSGAASLVSYLLGITHVDPIRHKLLFGRFLNPERKDLPDIDVDFPWDERDGLFAEIRASYGDERVALVSNHVGFGARASVREVAKVFGIPPAEIKEVTRRMNYWASPDNLWEHVKTYPKFRNFQLDPPWPEIIDLASRLESMPRNIGTHCGGIVLVPDRMRRYVPVQISAKGVPIIQWEKDQAEKAGLVKIDLLGNRTLAVIRDALSAIRENTGQSLDYPNLNPADDQPTIDLIKRGKTIGVFYLESPSMRLLLEKSQKGDFEHLVIHSSIIRPAANRYIQEYIRRIHGEPYEPLHPSIKDILDENYGILVYQEDVVQVAMIMAGFTWGEADALRKIIGKKSREQLSSYRERFAKGCIGNGIPSEVINKVWEMFISFSGYSFCKPHSASYTLVSLKSAYLKKHHPAEFMAAVISNGGGYYSTFAYVSEARRMGLSVEGPDINLSGMAWTGKEKSVRVGLQQLHSIRRDTVEAVLNERGRGGPFVSIEDFLRRVSIHPPDAAVLARSGSLDSLSGSLNRPRLLWHIQSWLNKFSGSNNGASKASKIQQTAFTPRATPIKVPALPDFADREKWHHEWETLGFILSVHPLQLADPFFRSIRRPLVSACDFHKNVGRKICVKAWPISRKEVYTRKGDEMEFFTFEDETEIFEAIFFPKSFSRFCQDLDMAHAYLLQGRVESEFGVVSLNVDYAYRVPERVH